MKTYTTIGVITGLFLAYALWTGQWPLFLLFIAFGIIGGVIGAHFDGQINLKEIASNIVGKGQG